MHLPHEAYKKVTKNLIVLSLHLNGLGQAMFFPRPSGNFKIIEFLYDKKMPKYVMKYVVAHELGHIYTGHLMPRKNETWKLLEEKADMHAKEWGFPKQKKLKNG